MWADFNTSLGNPKGSDRENLIHAREFQKKLGRGSEHHRSAIESKVEPETFSLWACVRRVAERAYNK
jgi:hypothetical protein